MCFNILIWTRSILGRSCHRNGGPVTLVGQSKGRGGVQKLNARLSPVVLGPRQSRVNHKFFRVAGETEPGVTMHQAEAELTVIAQRSPMLSANYPEKESHHEGFELCGDDPGEFRKTLLTLAGAFGCCGLIACTNVSTCSWSPAPRCREKKWRCAPRLGAAGCASSCNAHRELAAGGMGMAVVAFCV